ncbi:CDP-6-deoxy-L-threo-D-glycero-4-hexulose-3-dehydrase reductase [invertebrate metagenome]|uniref:CDP-6-deoxy-L-threo-D-glycero-4-hexulose-3-dehydrase reductase n=1 Tax=invertebrate metagenome TaxID=1711999 RepID=A0A2H9T865_9ZZZZ
MLFSQNDHGDMPENKTFKITLSRSGRVIPVTADMTLLDAFIKEKAPVIFACREGVCGVCKVRIEKGEVTSEGQTALTANEEKKGYVLSCCSKPKTDVTIAI